MDPNAALAIIRDDNLSDSDRLDAAIALDEWMAKGGFLPQAWQADEKQYLACGSCGEVFDTIETAHTHACEDPEYTIKEESEAF